MSTHATFDSEFFQLSSGEFRRLSDQLEYIHALNSEVGDALQALTADLAAPNFKFVPTPAEIAELCELSRDASLLMEEVIQAVTHRCRRNRAPIAALLGGKA